MGNLSLSIDTTNEITESLITYWNNLTDLFISKYIIKVNTIDPVVAEKYRYDMTGLLNSLNIPEIYHYPHIVVNGYTSSRDYTGEQFGIKIIDINKLDIYLQLFRKIKK